MKNRLLVCLIIYFLPFIAFSQIKFSGLEMNMGNLYRVSDAKTRSISPENFSGEKGKAGMADPVNKDKTNTANAFNAARGLGQGWKVNPYVIIKPGETFTMAVAGGAFCPPIMGAIADHVSMAIGFLIPMTCFFFIFYFGVLSYRKYKKAMI